MVFVVVVLGVAIGTSVWYADAFGLRTALGGGSAQTVVSCQFSGRVIDERGAPVVGARVRCDWEASDRIGETSSGMFLSVTDEQGRYDGGGAIAAEGVRHEAIRAHAKLVAYGELSECEPSSTHHFNLGATSEVEVELQLGAKRPTVPVSVSDRDGAPVTVFWAQTLPANGEADQDPDWPSAYKDFPEGVAALPVPSVPFCVEVHQKYGARRTVVGPFDPAALPARIEVTLAAR